MSKGDVSIAIKREDNEHFLFEAGRMHAACIPEQGESIQVKSSYTDDETVRGVVVDREWSFLDHFLVNVDIYIKIKD
ncbi:MAG: hypothetical protein ABEN55_03980 [Bradymonadaceae bacterium]